VQALAADCGRLSVVTQGRRIQRAAQILCLVWSKGLRLCACNLLTEYNKEEDLVDVAPGWG
jgi:hypothetical protein